MDYDVIVIGGGTAGLGAYRKAKSLGKKVLIVEGNDFVTTCANVGCMPSKLLIAAAENMAEINKAKDFGIDVEGVVVNNKKLWYRVRSERDRFVGFVKKGADGINEEDKLIGYAKFIDLHTIEVNKKRITSRTFVIATGSYPYIPEIFQPFKDEILTNENIFELDNIPKSIAVFGAGVIGLELGFALHHLGAEVSLFNRSKTLLKLNQDINEYLIQHLHNNFNFVQGYSLESVNKVENGFLIKHDDKELFVEKILVTSGRKSNLSSLGLDELLGENILNDYNPFTTQLKDLHIFVAGDANAQLAILHEAVKEGQIAGENAASYPHVKYAKRNVPMAVVFSSPQIMQVGNTTKLPEDVIKGTVSFEDQGRSRVMLKNKGLLNIYFDRKSQLLIGAEMIGPDAEHIAHLFAWIMEKETTLKEMLNFPFYHPVVEEGVRTAIRDAASKL